jgi:hypothetical protein
MLGAGGKVVPLHADDPVGLREGEPAEKGAVHDAEHGGGQADPQRQRQNDDRRVTGALSQETQTESEIFQYDRQGSLRIFLDYTNSLALSATQAPEQSSRSGRFFCPKIHF